MMRLRGDGLAAVGLSRFLQSWLTPWMLRRLPPLLTTNYIRLLVKTYYRLNGVEREEIGENLRAVLGRLPEAKRTSTVIEQAFHGMFRHYCEKLFVAYARFDRVCRFLEKRVETPRRHLLDEALSRGQGLLLVTAHFGAVEFLPLTLALHGFPVTMVVRFKTQRLKQALMERTQYVPVNLLDARDSDGVIFEAFKALKANRILITECDEFEAWRPSSHRGVRFLGCPCPIDRTIDVLQRRYRSPAVMGLVCRSNHNRYRLDLHSLGRDGEESAKQGLAEQALHVLERYVSMMPDQWYQWKNVRTILGTQIYAAEQASVAPEGPETLVDTGSALRTHEA